MARVRSYKPKKIVFQNPKQPSFFLILSLEDNHDYNRSEILRLLPNLKTQV